MASRMTLSSKTGPCPSHRASPFNLSEMSPMSTRPCSYKGWQTIKSHAAPAPKSRSPVFGLVEILCRGPLFGCSPNIGDVNAGGGLTILWWSVGLKFIFATSVIAGGELPRRLFSCSSLFSSLVFWSSCFSISFCDAVSDACCSNVLSLCSSSLTCRSLRSLNARCLQTRILVLVVAGKRRCK